jgi:hypothetical protein
LCQIIRLATCCHIINLPYRYAFLSQYHAGKKSGARCFIDEHQRRETTKWTMKNGNSSDDDNAYKEQSISNAYNDKMMLNV